MVCWMMVRAVGSSRSLPGWLESHKIWARWGRISFTCPGWRFAIIKPLLPLHLAQEHAVEPRRSSCS